MPTRSDLLNAWHVESLRKKFVSTQDIFESERWLEDSNLQRFISCNDCRVKRIPSHGYGSGLRFEDPILQGADGTSHPKAGSCSGAIGQRMVQVSL